MRLRAWSFDLRLRHTFTISRGSRDVVPTVFVSLEDEGIEGFGEASPSAYYGSTPQSVLASLEKARRILESADPVPYSALIDDLEAVVAPDMAALAALDLALHDWVGKRFGQPLHRLLGLDPARMPCTSFTIGMDTLPRMVEKAREAAAFPILKVKVGGPGDVEMVRALREVTDAVIRVDANGAWTAREAIEKSRALKDLGVEFMEQPLPRERNAEMAGVRSASALPVYADESAVTAQNTGELAGRFDGIVVKLVKCGGIRGALRQIETARAAGLKIMIGCMIESSLSISAAAQIGPLVDHLDIDGAILTVNDPFSGARIVDGRVEMPEGNGLGAAPRAGQTT